MSERRRQVVELNFPSSAEPCVSPFQKKSSTTDNRDFDLGGGLADPVYPSFFRNDEVAVIHEAESHCAMQSLLGGFVEQIHAFFALESHWAPHLSKSASTVGTPPQPHVPLRHTTAIARHQERCQGTNPERHIERGTQKLILRVFEMFPEFLLLEVRVWDPNRMKGSTSPSPPIPDR